jgi:hypothetical protein
MQLVSGSFVPKTLTLVNVRSPGRPVLWRPFLLLRDMTVLMPSLMLGIAYFGMSMMNIILSVYLASIYQLSSTMIGFCYLPFGLGNFMGPLIGAFLSAVWMTTEAQKTDRRQDCRLAACAYRPHFSTSCTSTGVDRCNCGAAADFRLDDPRKPDLCPGHDLCRRFAIGRVLETVWFLIRRM